MNPIVILMSAFNRLADEQTVMFPTGEIDRTGAPIARRVWPGVDKTCIASTTLINAVRHLRKQNEHWPKMIDDDQCDSHLNR
jgi:poly-beta-hydroxyalkanoate depolymerase